MEAIENMQDFNIPTIDHENQTSSAGNTIYGDQNVIADHSAPFVAAEKVVSDSPIETQETDNEALSSLLMLSKSNADQTKAYNNEVSREFCIIEK